MTIRRIHPTVFTAVMLTFSPAAAPASQSPAPKAAAPAAPARQDDTEKSSYAVGMNLGAALRRRSPDLNADLIVQGFRDALAGDKTRLSAAEMRTILNRLQAEMKAKEAAERSEAGVKSKSEGDAFLAENKTKPGVVTLESGLQYKVLKAGEGRKPTIDDSVVCQYRGTLIDGTEFDSSLERDKPATMAVKKVIKGWSEALQLMPVGSKWQLFIPPSLAYGERGAGRKIGPNAVLIFELELIGIQDVANPAASKNDTGTDGPLDTTAGPTTPAIAGINVSFKVDPRITKGLYMGDRWVSAPHKQVGEGKQVTVDAKAEGVDDRGKAVSVNPRWISADPGIVTVTPAEGNAVKITALRAGQSTLRVTSQGVSRELAVKAGYAGEVLQVEISQPQ